MAIGLKGTSAGTRRDSFKRGQFGSYSPHASGGIGVSFASRRSETVSVDLSFESHGKHSPVGARMVIFGGKRLRVPCHLG